MSRKTTIEFLGRQRRLYQALKGYLKRKLILANFCEATGYSHKYANKLLTGNRMPHEHPGRGKTYTAETLRLLEDMWYKLGCPCPRYLVARIGKNLADYKAVVNVPPDCQAQMLAVSAATLTRHLRAGEEQVAGGVCGGQMRAVRGEVAVHLRRRGEVVEHDQEHRSALPQLVDRH